MQTLAANLRAERARRDWSQQVLAEKAGVSALTIREIEGEKANPALLTLQKIAAPLGLTVVDLLTGPSGEQADNDRSDSVRSNQPSSSPSVASKGAATPDQRKTA